MKNFNNKIALLTMFILVLTLLTAGCGSESEPAKEASSSATTQNDSGASKTLQALRAKGVLVVGSSNDAPFAYMDVTKNTFSGVDAEIIEEIAKRLGIEKVEMKQVPFENLLLELNNKTVDMVTDAMYIKKERLDKALFTDIWYKEGEAVVVKADSPIQTKEDLKDKVIGGQKGVTFLELAQKWQSEGKVKEVKVFNSQAELMMAVNTGKIDACITDGIVAAYTLKQNTNMNLRLLTPYEAEAGGKIGAALRFEDKDFLAEVNKTLNEMRADGTLSGILEKYGLTKDYMVLSNEEAKTVNVK